MALSQLQLARNTYNDYVAASDMIISSDAELVIDGRESASLLIKNFPYPVISPGEGIEIPMQMGLKKWQKSQVVIQQQGSVSLRETVRGQCFKLNADLLKNGGLFNARIYEGTRKHYLRYFRLIDCHIQLDPGERDFESNTQVLEISGNLFYHYFGEMVEGNMQNVQAAYAGLRA